MIDLRQHEAVPYRKAQRRRARLAAASSAAVIVGASLVAGTIDRALPGPVVVRGVLLGAIVAAALELDGLPLGIASHRASVAAGIARQTIGGWLTDRAKGWAIGAVIGLPAVAGLIAAQRAWPAAWWIAAWAATLALAVLATVIAPVLLLPLFVRSAPLQPGPLRTMAEELVARAGLHVRSIRLLELSAKTSASNAAVVGIGPTRQILLGDTLAGDGSDGSQLAETEAVLAHELAHHATGDVWRGLALEAATGIACWAAAAAILAALPRALAHGGAGSASALPALALSYGLVALPAGLVGAWHSRRRERAADRYACALADPGAFARALERLVATNLAELVPPALVRLRATHPAPGARIAAAKEYAQGERTSAR